MEDMGNDRVKVNLDPTNMVHLHNHFHTTELINECFDCSVRIYSAVMPRTRMCCRTVRRCMSRKCARAGKSRLRNLSRPPEPYEMGAGAPAGAHPGRPVRRSVCIYQKSRGESGSQNLRGMTRRNHAGRCNRYYCFGGYVSVFNMRQDVDIRPVYQFQFSFLITEAILARYPR